MAATKARCLVLNGTYEPLSVISSRRALILVYKGKASVLKEHATDVIRTSGATFAMPSKIVLKNVIKMPRNVPAKLTHKNLWVRDDYTCQYCHRHRDTFKPGEKLTVDHVHPRDLGGKHKWTNVVACCPKCNNIKANFTLDQMVAKGYTYFVLKKQPYAPTTLELKHKIGEFHDLM